MTPSTATDTRSLTDAVKAGDVAMLVTHHDGTPHSRPVTVAKVVDDTLMFLVDRQARWFADTATGTQVHVAISASGRNDWVSLNGAAQPTSDRTLIDELWNPAAGAFFDGKDDPNIVVLGVAVTEGEYWSAPGGGPLGRLMTVVAAALGKKGDAGEHGDID